ncbi:helix-turn-helix transcriptional regulator [Flavisolibacter sp. BT320]|nr:helix-turn-helix transcriptional regulator [Flavisolibacter longurius]
MENRKLRDSQSLVMSALYMNRDITQTKKVQKAKQLASRIEVAIKEKGINKSAFANMMGVQPSVITKWLSGGHNFTIDTLFDIEENLEIDLFAFNLHPLDKTIRFYASVHSNEPRCIETDELKLDLIKPSFNSNKNVCYQSKLFTRSERI